MTKKILLTCLLLINGMILFAQKATDDLSGKYKTPQGKTIIISKSGNGFIGQSEDKKLTILKDIQYKKNKWTGTIIKPADGTTADCDLVLKGKDLQITAHKGIFSKKLTWVKE